MHRKAHWGLLAVASLIMLVTLSACDSGGGGLSVEEVLANSSQAMQEITSVQFFIERDGELPVVEANTGAKLISVEGLYVAPDTVSATVRADLFGSAQDIAVEWSPEGATLSIVGLGITQEIPDDFPLNPVAVFGADGLPAVLVGQIDDAELGSEESFEGTPVYQISGTVTGEALTTLVAGVVEVEEAVSLNMYIHRETFLVVRFELTEDSGDSWLIEFFSYNEVATE